jgi:hypothetical protein
MTGYWTQFAKTGDPNGSGLPPWTVYDLKSDLVLEIGHEVKLRPTPHPDRFAVFERSLNSRLASISTVGQGARPDSADNECRIQQELRVPQAMIPHVIDMGTNFTHEKDSRFWADDGLLFPNLCKED